MTYIWENTEADFNGLIEDENMPTNKDQTVPDEMFIVLDSSGTGDAFRIRQTAIEHARDADPDYMKEFGPITVNRYIHERALLAQQAEHEKREHVLEFQIAEHEAHRDAAKPVCWLKHGPYEHGSKTEVVFDDPKDDVCYSPLYFTSERTDAAVAEAMDQLLAQLTGGAGSQIDEESVRQMIRALKPRSDMVCKADK